MLSPLYLLFVHIFKTLLNMVEVTFSRLCGTFSRLFGSSSNCLENHVRKSSRLSEIFLACLEILQAVWKSSILLEIFQFWLTGNLPDCLEHFQTVKKCFTPSRNFRNCSNSFQTFWKSSRLSGNLQDSPEIV